MRTPGVHHQYTRSAPGVHQEYTSSTPGVYSWCTPGALIIRDNIRLWNWGVRCMYFFKRQGASDLHVVYNQDIIVRLVYPEEHSNYLICTVYNKSNVI